MKSFKIACLIVCIALSACNKYIVKTINYDAATGHVSYRNASGEDITNKKHAAKEGEDITVSVHNSNPLSNNVSVTQGQSEQHYMENKSQFSMSPATITANNNNDTENLNEENTSHPPSIPKIVENIHNKEEKFENFYNSIAELNYLLNQFKADDKLTNDCICRSLISITQNIQENFFDTSLADFIDTCNTGSAICPGIPVDMADKMIDQAKKYQTFFANAIDALSTLQTDNSTTERNKQAIAAVLKTVIALNKSMNEEYTKNIITVAQEYQLLYHLKFDQDFGPFVPEETDVLKLNITVDNKFTTTTSNQPINLFVAKAIKIDFSTGIFATNLLDEDFKITKNQSDTTYSYSKFKPNKLGYGAIGFVNFHPIFPRFQSISFGGSIGTGLMFNNSAKFVLAPSISVLFGKYQRVIVHLGAAIGQVDRVSSIYEEGESYKEADYKPEIKSQVQVGFLGSISWNLSTK